MALFGYGAPPTFLTLAFSEPDNTNILRSTYRTMDNKSFPAIFDCDNDEYTSISDYMDHILKCTIQQATGDILIPAHPTNSRGSRRACVNNNPVACVIESKTIINDVLSILLGVSPEDVFSYYESTSTRKTKFYKSTKGVYGHLLSTIGVVESDAKGSLHYHLLLFGGLSPKLLSRFAHMDDVCREITAVWDQSYKSQIATDVKLSHLIKKTARQNPAFGLKHHELGAIEIPPLLNNQRNQKITQLLNDPTKNINMDIVYDLTNHQGCIQQFHDHMATCRKGFHGLTGCRLCMPCGFVNFTCPVLLCNECTGEPWQDPNNSIERPGSYLFRDRERPDMEPFTVHETMQPLSSALLTPDTILHPKFSEHIVVWETRRQKDFFDLEPPLMTAHPSCEKEMHKFFVTYFGNVLLPVLAFGNESPFWEWINTAPIKLLCQFWKKLGSNIIKSNGEIATYNPILSLCLGSHNNASLLGTEEQAKSAIFYVCPYMGKLKYPLLHSLAVINQVAQDIKKFPSIAPDSGSNSRTTKHLLQRTLNNMLLKMELSDFQVCADLLGLPCLIRTDPFAYLDYSAAMAYQSLVDYDEEDAAQYHREEINYVSDSDDDMSSFIENDTEHIPVVSGTFRLFGCDVMINLFTNTLRSGSI